MAFPQITKILLSTQGNLLKDENSVIKQWSTIFVSFTFPISLKVFQKCSIMVDIGDEYKITYVFEIVVIVLKYFYSHVLFYLGHNKPCDYYWVRLEYSYRWSVSVSIHFVLDTVEFKKQAIQIKAPCIPTIYRSSLDFVNFEVLV